MQKIVLSLCDYTGVMLRPWVKAGYRCIAVDIQHEPGTTLRDGIEYVGADIFSYIPPNGDYAFVSAFPPCTHLAVSGARWFQSKGMGKLVEGLSLVERCRMLCEWAGAPYFLENPVSTLSTYWRKPDYTFNPCDYGGYIRGGGDAYTKKTCLWVGNGFIMPEFKPVEPTEGSKMHLLPPSVERANLRSATPEGFAIAVFEANELSRKELLLCG